MKHNQRGISLVELMIAVTLALMLSGAAISAFLSVERVNSTTAGVAGLADNGRFAFEQMGSAVRTAGYLACSASTDARIDLATTLPILVTDIGEPLAGYEYTGTNASGAFTMAPPYGPASSASNWGSAPTFGGHLDALIFAASAGTGSVGKPIAGSDVIAMHGSPVGVESLYLTGTASVGSASLLTTISPTITNTGFASLLAAGSTPVAVVSNCQSAEVFAIGGVSGAQLSLSTANSIQTLVTAYSAGSHVTLVDTRIYYIGMGTDGEGALYVLDTGGATGFASPVELVPDVENMQVLYGVDTTGAKAATEYVTADKVASTGITGDFNSVIDVRIALLLVGALGTATPSAAAPTYSLLGTIITAPIDTRLRSVFTGAFTLRNNAG